MRAVSRKLSASSATRAGVTHDANPTGEPEIIELTAHLGLLRDGANVLAIQGLNATAASDDLLIAPRLVGSDAPPPTWPAPRFEEGKPVFGETSPALDDPKPPFGEGNKGPVGEEFDPGFRAPFGRR